MPERFSVSPGRPLPLGVTVEDDGINLAVVSHSAERIFICVFDQSGDHELARLALPGRTDDEVHHGFVAGIKPGTRYGLRAEGLFDPKRGHRFDPAKLLA